MARSDEYTEYAEMVIGTHPFCVAMTMQILGCSRNFLYHQNIVPEQQGGRFCKNLPRPTLVPTKPSLRKPFAGQYLKPLDQLVNMKCCGLGCVTKMTPLTLSLHREKYRKGNQVRCHFYLLISRYTQ
jgi:hypothetical protein